VPASPYAPGEMDARVAVLRDAFEAA